MVLVTFLQAEEARTQKRLLSPTEGIPRNIFDVEDFQPSQQAGGRFVTFVILLLAEWNIYFLPWRTGSLNLATLELFKRLFLKCLLDSTFKVFWPRGTTQRKDLNVNEQ